MEKEIKISVYYTDEEDGKRKLVDTDSIREEFERQLEEVLDN